MGAQTDIFRRRVRDTLVDPPPVAACDIAVSDAVLRLSEARESGIVLVDDDCRPAGILTEADVARRVAFRLGGAEPVSAAMTSPVVTVEETEYLYRAIATMRRKALRHLPVVDAAGRLAGMLHLDRATAVLSDDLMERIDRLSEGGSETALAAVKAAEAEIAADLLADGSPVADILALITHVNNDVYRRVAEGILRETTDAPPAEFALIVMGSGGREENFLAPDQDNGLVIADYADIDHPRIDAWFIDFAERLTARMNAVGFPLCKGHVMATNPLWRKTQTQWREQIGIWMRRRSAAAVLLSDIFFDFAPVAGSAELAQPLRGLITAAMPENHPFLGDMLAQHEGMRSALGLFGRFRTERGMIHLKHYGTQPVVTAIRLLALKAGVPSVSTLARIQALGEAGVLDADERAEITDAFNTVCRLLLQSQIASFEAGAPATNYVAPTKLRRAERRDLRLAFRTIDSLCDRVRADFTGEIF